MKKHVASFANFILHFGDKKALLDYAEEVVIPSFTDRKLTRGYGETSFNFYQTKVVKLEEDAKMPVLGIAGRFVKDSVLRSEQVYDERGSLKQQDDKIRTSPSSFFILILNNHRLIYFPEVAHAPKLGEFRSTAQTFIRQKHRAFIDAAYERLKEEGEKITKKELWKTHPRPDLEVVPLAGGDEISDFLDRYETLKKVEFRLLRPNHEVDGEPQFDAIRKYLGTDLDATSTKVVASSAEGLDKDAVLDRIQKASATGNQEIVLSGEDHAGNKLQGDNEEFKIQTEIGTVPKTRKALEKKLYDTYKSLVENGAIKVGKAAAGAANKITRILNTLL